jgi:3-oxoacyl-[acyl-carrier protein] reductase
MSRVIEKRILITGSGARGSIGRATALALAKEGADIAVHDLPSREDEAREVVEEVSAMGRRACLLLGDLTDMGLCRRLVSEAISQLGQLDVLVNNAGSALYSEFIDVDEKTFDHQIALHLKAPFFLAQEAARHMLKRGQGKIINVSSELAYVGEPVHLPYSMAKGGLLTMTRSMALTLAPAIQVNAVAPGPTATDEFKESWEYNDEIRDAVPLKRFGTPDEVARSILFLASSDGDIFTGQTLDPNGGTVMP